jgi:hypothetical protein
VITDEQWEKYQGELQCGNSQALHNGPAVVIGKEVPGEKAMAVIYDEIILHGVPEQDRYTL